MNKKILKKIKDNTINELKTLKIKNFFILFLAGVINSIGVTMFLAPVNLYDSGISGTSMLLWQVTPDYLNLSVFLIILNFPLFIFGLKFAMHGCIIYDATKIRILFRHVYKFIFYTFAAVI